MASSSHSELILNNFTDASVASTSTENKEDIIVQTKISKNPTCSKILLGNKVSLQNENESPVEELLGSVTTFNNVLGGSEQILRTSARVIKKLKQDSLVSISNEKEKKEIKVGEKTEVKPKGKTTKAPWSVIEKNLFFEALNEFGKDFECITQYISNKMKRRGVCDSLLKNKDQVRHFYYRTWNKISKYITFNSSLKKVVQELYVLINYGEMRKKIFLINDKTSLKLCELIYRGSVPLRMKGKTFRIKTPMCKALRRLNQMEEWQEELKLPTRVLVELQPSTSEAWHRVQSVAHNPRVTAMMPVQRRLSNLLTVLNNRWKTYDTKLLQKLTDLSKGPVQPPSVDITQEILHFGPRSGVQVNKPIINLSEYMTCNRICLNSYEDRLGITEKSEMIFASTIQNFKGGGRKGSKRQRSESAGEKKIVDAVIEPDNKKVKIEISESSSSKSKDDICPAIKPGQDCIVPEEVIKKDIPVVQDIDAKLEVKSEIQIVPKSETKSKTKERSKMIRKKTNTSESKSIITEKEIKIEEKFKYGWTLEDAADVTFGDLYLMFGSDAKIQMEYWWDRVKKPTKNIESDKNIVKAAPTASKDQNENISKKSTENSEILESHLLLPYKTEVFADNKPDGENSDKILQTTELTRRLKQLLFCFVANDKNKKNTCSCGHVCNEKTSSGASKNASKRLQMSALMAEAPGEQSIQSYISQKSVKPVIRDSTIFRPPLPITSKAADNFETQINSLMKIKPRWNNRRGRTVRSKQVVVQRMLPLLPKSSSNSGYVHMNFANIDVAPKSIGQPRMIAPRQLNFGPDAPHNANRNPELRIISTIEPQILATNNSITVTNNEIKSSNYNTTFITSKRQPTSTIVSNSAEEQNHLIQEPLINDNLSDTNFSLPIDELSIGSSTIAEAQEAFIQTDHFEDILDQNRSTSISPSRLLNSSDSTWFNSELHDFSLSSFLGHLESPAKPQTSLDEVKISQDVDTNMHSLLNESSVDYMAKFAALAAQISNQNVNK